MALQREAGRESREQGSSDRRGRRRCSRIAGSDRGGAEGRRAGAGRRRFNAWELGRGGAGWAGRELVMRLAVRFFLFYI